HVVRELFPSFFAFLIPALITFGVPFGQAGIPWRKRIKRDRAFGNRRRFRYLCAPKFSKSALLVDKSDFSNTGFDKPQVSGEEFCWVSFFEWMLIDSGLRVDCR